MAAATASAIRSWIGTFNRRKCLRGGGEKERWVMPRRDFSPGCGDDISADDNIYDDDNLFTSLIVGYSQLIDDSRVRLRIGEIIARAMCRPPRGGGSR